MPWGKKARKTEEESEGGEEGNSGEDFNPKEKEAEESEEDFSPEVKPKKEAKPKGKRGKKAGEASKTTDEKPESKEPKSPKGEEESAKKEAKPKAKRGKKNAEPIPEAPVIPETTPEEVQSFINANQDSPNLSHSLYELFKNSSAPRLLINSAVSAIFSIVESNPTRFEWGRKLIQALSNDFMEPKARLREAHFFPNPESENKLIKHLLSAKKTMIICVFALTNNNLADAIRKAKSNGVDIRLIFDDEMMRNPGSDVKALHDEGYQVRVDLDPKAHMHNKFVVIDDRILITGSYNWTKQATNKNNENVVIFEDRELAEIYTKEFNRLWDEFAASVDQHLGGEKKEVKVDT